MGGDDRGVAAVNHAPARPALPRRLQRAALALAALLLAGPAAAGKLADGDDAPAGAAPPSAAAACRQTPFGDAMQDELARLRGDPGGYAARIAGRYASMDDDGVFVQGGRRILAHEGRRAPDETVERLRTLAPLPPLDASPCLAAAAEAHANDQATGGLRGHLGTDGARLGERVRRFMPLQGQACAELLSFGHASAHDVLVDLLVDDGVPSRSHRTLLLDTRFVLAGAAIAPHPATGTIAVVVVCGPAAQRVVGR